MNEKRFPAAEFRRFLDASGATSTILAVVINTLSQPVQRAIARQSALLLAETNSLPDVAKILKEFADG